MSRRNSTLLPSVAKEQNRFRASQMESGHNHHTLARAGSQMRAADGYSTSANPRLSQEVNEGLKELRSMSSSHTVGRGFQNSDFGNGPPQKRSVHGLENSSRAQNPHSGQQHGPFPPPPPPPPGSSVPFPPPSFNPSLPPPGLPPFHGPSPTAGSSGHSSAMFSSPPPPPMVPQQSARPFHPPNNAPGVPPLPSQGARLVPPPNNLPGAPSPGGLGMPSHAVGTNAVGLPMNISRPPPAWNNVRMAGPSQNTSTAHPSYVPSSAPSNLFLPPPPLPGQLPLSGQNISENSLQGSKFSIGQSGFPVPGQMPASKPPVEVESTSGSTGAQQEVNMWLQKRGKQAAGGSDRDNKHKAGATGTSVEAESKGIPLTIGKAQNRVRCVLHALAAVQGELHHLEEQQATADEDTWQSSVAKITQLKDAYMEAKRQLDVEQFKTLKRKLDARRKKRERQKRRRQEEKEAEQQVQFERAQKHAAIDQWREKLRQEDLNQQQMKKMKETADRTLSKVRREIRETRKMMDTVARLQKLRAIRNDTAEKRGQTFPVSVATHFTEKTHDLSQLLDQQLQAFEKEEAALKLILETEKEEAKEKEKEEKRRKEIEVRQSEMEEEQQSLFGSQGVPVAGDPLQPFSQYYLQAQCSVHALLNIRQEWDSFLVPDHTPMASRIPDEWVSPEPPSSVWASILQSSKPS